MINFVQYYFSVDFCSNVVDCLDSNNYFYSGGILSLRYFLSTFVPPFRIFCLMDFSGLPYICNLTNELMNPISHGIYGRSLFYKSNVFSFCNWIIYLEIFVSLLLDKIKTVRFGQLEKILYYFRLLYARFIVSSFYERGIY